MAGGIDRIEDSGIQWRINLKNKAIEKGLEIKWLDPCDKPEWLGSEVGTEKSLTKKLINEGKWQEAREYVKKFRHFDLRAVDISDFMIVKIDIKTHICGTYDEIFTAEDQLKPILVIMGEGQKKEDIPTWLISFINEDNIFESEDECINYLVKINNGEIKLDDRWVKWF